MTHPRSLGLYLSDLVFIAELPTFIESDGSDSSSSDEENADDRELCERLRNQLVNYNKFRITGKKKDKEVYFFIY